MLPLAGATTLRKAEKVGLVKSKTVGQKMLKEVLKAEQSNDSPLQWVSISAATHIKVFKCMWERLSKEFTHPVIHGHYSGLLTEAAINREICSLVLTQKVSFKNQPFDSKELTSTDVFTDWSFSKNELKISSLVFTLEKTNTSGNTKMAPGKTSRIIVIKIF